MVEGICKHCGIQLVLGQQFPGNKRIWLAKEAAPLSQYCWVDPVNGSQLHCPVEEEKSVTLPIDLYNQWRDAYSAFIGAFDTPVARLKHSDAYAVDARRRLAEFDVKMINLVQGKA